MSHNENHLYALDSNDRLVHCNASLRDRFTCVCGCQTQLIPLQGANGALVLQYRNSAQPCPSTQFYRNARLCERALGVHWSRICYKSQQCTICNVPTIDRFFNVANVTLPDIDTHDATQTGLMLKIAMRHLQGTVSTILVLAPDYYGTTNPQKDNLHETPSLCMQMQEILQKMPHILSRQEVTMENMYMTRNKCIQCQVHENRRHLDQAVHALRLGPQDKLTFDMAFSLVPDNPRAFLYLSGCTGPSETRRALDYLPPPRKQADEEATYTKQQWHTAFLAEEKREQERVAIAKQQALLAQNRNLPGS